MRGTRGRIITIGCVTLTTRNSVRSGIVLFHRWLRISFKINQGNVHKENFLANPSSSSDSPLKLLCLNHIPFNLTNCLFLCKLDRLWFELRRLCGEFQILVFFHTSGNMKGGLNFWDFNLNIISKRWPWFLDRCFMLILSKFINKRCS